MDDTEISIEILKFVQGGKTADDILKEFRNTQGERILKYLYTEDFVDEKDGKMYLNEAGEKNLKVLLNENQKIRRKEFWKHPLVVSIIIAIITAIITALITILFLSNQTAP